MKQRITLFIGIATVIAIIISYSAQAQYSIYIDAGF